jgi:Ca2+-binding RTX toxin-like protein
MPTARSATIPNHAFDSLHLAAPGTGAANTTAPDSFTYTLTNGNTATVSLTVNGVNNANTIYEGAGGDDTITGDATLGGLYHLEQGGNDTVTGGSGNDGFYFGAAFTAWRATTPAD